MARWPLRRRRGPRRAVERAGADANRAVSADDSGVDVVVVLPDLVVVQALEVRAVGPRREAGLASLRAIPGEAWLQPELGKVLL